MNIDKVIEKQLKKPSQHTVYPLDDTQSVNDLTRCVEGIVDEICLAIKEKSGICPFSQRRGNHVFLIWPVMDGEFEIDDEVVTDIEIYLD